LRTFCLATREQKASLVFIIKKMSKYSQYTQRNRVVAANPNSLFPISLHPNVVDLWYAKLWDLFDQTFEISKVYTISLQRYRAGLENFSLWQKLSYFLTRITNIKTNKILLINFSIIYGDLKNFERTFLFTNLIGTFRRWLDFSAWYKIQVCSFVPAKHKPSWR